MKRPGTRRAAFLLGGAAIVLAALAAPLLWIERHAPFPGETGCMFIQSQDHRWECYSNVYERRLLEPDREAYLRRIDQKGKTNQRFENDCHEGMHIAVRRMIIERGVDPWDLLIRSPGVSNCTRGIQHALLEATIGRDQPAFKGILEELCNLSGDDSERFNCHHGFGHAVMYHTGQDLDASLERCRGLGKNRLIDGCIDGVYMQHSFNLNTSKPERDPAKAFERVCTNVRPNEMLRCFQQAVTAFTAPESGLRDAPQSRKVCAAMHDPLAMVTCLSGTSFKTSIDEIDWCVTELRYSTDDLVSRCTLQTVASS